MGSAWRHVPVKRFRMEQNRNAEACLRGGPLLSGIDYSHRAAGVAIRRDGWLTDATHIVRPRDLADTVRHELRGFRGIESPLRIQNGAFGFPHAPELRDFFLERHPPEQIFNTALGRQVRAPIVGCILRLNHVGCAHCEAGRGHCQHDASSMRATPISEPGHPQAHSTSVSSCAWPACQITFFGTGTIGRIGIN
jgi:hypothetical protein